MKIKSEYAWKGLSATKKLEIETPTYHEGIVEGSEDVSNSEVLIAIGNLVLKGGDLLDGLFFLSRSLSLIEIGQKRKHYNSFYFLHLHHWTKELNHRTPRNNNIAKVLTIVDIKCRDKEGSKLWL